MPRTRITVQVPRAASSGGGGSSAELSGPYLTQMIEPFPDADGDTYIFGIHGLSESDAVEWSTALGEDDYVPNDVFDAHTLVVVDMGGTGGSVTATVNGEVLGAATYGA